MNPCDCCHKDVDVEFHVNPHLWHVVTNSKDYDPTRPYDGGDGYLCLACFIEKAKAVVQESFYVEVFLRR